MRKTHKRRLLAALAAAALLAAVSAPAAALTPGYAVSSAFAASEYYTRLEAVTLTGDYRADILNVALSQVGYHEGANTRERHGDNLDTDGNYTEYGYFSNCDGYAWCAMFVSWCARQAQIPTSVIFNSRTARSYSFGVTFREKGSDYVPQPGDLVFFAEKGHVWDHVGLVLSNEGECIYTVEGNSRNMVRVRRYALDDEYIRGYGDYGAPPIGEGLLKRGLLYTVNYDFNGGEGERQSQYALENARLGLYKNAPEEHTEAELEAEGAEKKADPHYVWREGYTFAGWYVRRDRDGKWLTVRDGWMDDAQIVQRHCFRRIYADNAGVTIDSRWSLEDFSSFTFYAVWKDEATGRYVDESAFIVNYDSKGWANCFRDLQEGGLYYEPVKKLIRGGLVDGVSEHCFGADEEMTRAQFLALLYHAAGEPETEERALAFTDVDRESWYYPAVCWAAEKAIIQEGNELQPEARITREELIACLYAYALSSGRARRLGDATMTMSMLRTLLRFSDAATTSPACLEAIVWAQDTGLLKEWGIEGRGSLLPKTVETRLEACGLLGMYLDFAGEA